MFHESGDDPKLTWVKSERTSNGQFWTTECDLSEYDEDFKNIDFDKIRKFSRGNRKNEGIEIWPCNDNGRGNHCIQRLMLGPRDLDLDFNCTGLWGDKFYCSCVMVRFKGVETAPHKQYQDISLGDLRLAFNSFCEACFEDEDLRGVENDPHGVESLVVLESVIDKAAWIEGAIISCNGEMNGKLKCEKFRVAYLRKTDPIFEKAVDISSISEHLGFPVVLQSVHITPFWCEDEAYENAEAMSLLLGADQSGNDWNTAHISKEDDIDGISPVLVVRLDRQVLTVHQVEALAAYCSDVLQSAMTEPEGEEYTRDIKQAIVDTYMTYEKFCDFFEQYKAHRLEAGHADWLDAKVPPQSTDAKTAEEDEPQRLAKRKRALDSIDSRLGNERNEVEDSWGSKTALELSRQRSKKQRMSQDYID